MGDIGWSNIFLTPEFGPRVRLAFIFTDAELEPDPIMEPYLCDRCGICVAKCSSGAISKDEAVSFTIEGKTYSYAKLDEEKCEVGFHVGNPERNPFLWDGSDDTEVVRWLMDAVYNDKSEINAHHFVKVGQVRLHNHLNYRNECRNDYYIAGDTHAVGDYLTKH